VILTAGHCHPDLSVPETAADTTIITLPFAITGVNTVAMWDGALNTTDMVRL
jgi:hypothetical protein